MLGEIVFSVNLPRGIVVAAVSSIFVIRLEELTILFDDDVTIYDDYCNCFLLWYGWSTFGRLLKLKQNQKVLLLLVHINCTNVC